MSTPLWGPRPQGGFGSSGGFSNPWGGRGGGSSGGGFNNPPPVTPPIKEDAGATPGTFGVNIMNPAESAGKAVTEATDWATGLKNALFGSQKADAQGNRGGLLGGVPIISDLGRFATQAVGTSFEGVAAGIGGSLDAIGGGLEHVDMTSPYEKAELDRQYKALPQDSPAKLDADAAIARDPGAKGAYMSRAVRARSEEIATDTPDLFAGLVSTPGSAADTVTNLFGVLGLAQRGTERLIAGMSKGDGMNQLEIIMAVGRGEVAFDQSGIAGTGWFNTNAAGLGPAEQIVFDKMTAKEWTETQALDFMASHGIGLAHSQALQIAGTFATDPLNVASLGAVLVAKAGLTGAQLAKFTAGAVDDVARLRAAGATAAEIAAAEQVVIKSQGAMRAAGSSAKLNVLGRAAQTKGGTDIMRVITKPYIAIQGTAIGKTAKLARTIIDPLHALDLKMPGSTQNVDLLSDVTSRSVVNAYGDVNHLNLLTTLRDMAPDGALYDQMVGDLGTYSAYVARRVVATKHRAAQIVNGLGERLIQTTPDDVMDDLLQANRRDVLDTITEEAQRQRIRSWDEPALDNLATRLERLWGTTTEVEWKAAFAKMNPDQLSMLHAASFGNAQRRLLGAVGKAAGAGKLGDKAHRFTLISKTTLTKLGGQGIIDRIGSSGSLKGSVEELKAAQAQYPELRYFSFDPTAPGESVDSFVQSLTRRLDALPMQITDDEMKGMHESFQSLADDLQGSYTLAIRPEDAYLWGLERSNMAEGGYHAVDDVWVDYVADAMPGFRAGREVPTNIAGKPILGAVARGIVKPIDYIEAMGRVMKARVSGTLIAEAAREKFAATAVTRFGDRGMTEADARGIFQGLQDALRADDIVINPRGLTEQSMWTHAETLVPKKLLASDFNKRDLLKLVLDAYDGDVRFIGVTQKFTGRVKAMLGDTVVGNSASVIAEHAYPLLKFRLSPIFQVQEKIEPWVLNAQRGAHATVGTKMSPADEATEAMLDKMVQHSLVRQGDVDQVEYAAEVLHDGTISALGKMDNTVTGSIKRASTALSDTKGLKRINMLRTFRRGLGQEIKTVWESHHPGLFEEMKQQAQRQAGNLLHDDDFAVRIMSEQMLGNDVAIQMLDRLGNKMPRGSWKADFKAAIAPGQWALPSHLGELKALNLDDMARLLDLPVKGGPHATTQAAIRKAMADGSLTMDDVKSVLRQHGADPDYVTRVENALSFSWTGFWQTVTEKYGLTSAETRGLEDMFAASAEMRGMTPIDYISQVFNPNIKEGVEGTVGSLGRTVELLRAGLPPANVSDLATLAIKPGLSDRADLVGQLSRAFSAHLDPSAKWALLQEFRPELVKGIRDGNVNLDITELNKMWDEGAETELAQKLMGYMDATDGDVFEANLPRTPEEFTAIYPDRTFTLKGDDDMGEPDRLVVQTVGDGVRNAPPALRDAIVGNLGRLRAEFPEVPFGTIDIIDLGDEGLGLEAVAFAVGSGQDNGSIFLNKTFFGDDWEEVWARQAASESASRTKTHFANDVIVSAPRESHYGVAFSADSTPMQTLRHEYGHVLDLYMRSGIDGAMAGKVARSRAGKKRFKTYTDFVNSFDGSEAQALLSEYSNSSPSEAIAELLSLALDKDADLTRFATEAPWKSMDPDDLPVGFKPRGREAFTDAVDDPDFPVEARFLPSPNGPATVQDAVAEVRQILRDVGVWKEAPEASANPDIVRTARMFGKWTEGAVNQGLLRGAQSQFSGILNDIARIPTEGAVPYNQTEALLVRSATDAMTRKWEDAYRLQYFAQRRSMLERSINHPMFGIYPASYMWGKMLPEMARFVAREPFGVRTGAMAYSLNNVQQAIGIQREYDPEFDKLIEDMGHGQAMWMAGYLLPATTWDVGAAFPAWTRDIAQQGLDNEAAIEAGEPAEGINLIKPAIKALDTFSPSRSVKQVESVTREMDKFFGDEGDSAPAALEPEAPRYGQPGYEGKLSDEPVQGSALGPTLEQELLALKQALSN